MESKQNVQNYIDQIQDFQNQVYDLKADHDRQKKKQGKSDDIIRRQTQNIQQLVEAAKNLKDKLREQELLGSNQNDMQKERDDAQKYVSLVEARFKEVSKSEENANVKVLTLLDTVKKLQQENSDLL